MILGRWRNASERESRANELYQSVVRQARNETFYGRYGVPDTLDGRFEMIALHAFLLLHRLKRDNPEAAALSQSFYDVFFADMDRSLREMGAGDLGVGRRVRRMAEAFAGRIAAYEKGIAATGNEILAEALRRNLYGTVAAVPDELVGRMVSYLKRQSRHLDAQGYESLASGKVDFDFPG